MSDRIMANTPILPPKNMQARPVISRQIDVAYITGTRNASFLRRYLLSPRGNFKQVYLDFWECFDLLITLTSPHKEVIDPALGDLSKEWRLKTPSKENAIKGLDLFDDYAKSLAKHGLIKIK